MQLTLLKCKLHRACVTHAELDYEGSCAIDEHLMVLAGIREYEQIQIYNVTNGERFHKASPGDRVIICAYAAMDAAEANAFSPSLVYLDERNRVIRTGDAIPAQAA